MVFKNECTKFLDTVVALRQNTINREIQKEIELKHAPYKLEMERVRDEVIAQEIAEAEKEIRKIQEKRDLKINSVRDESARAIQTNRENIIAATTERVSREYDNFILGVSNLVDATNIKD